MPGRWASGRLSLRRRLPRLHDMAGRETAERRQLLLRFPVLAQLAQDVCQGVVRLGVIGENKKRIVEGALGLLPLLFALVDDAHAVVGARQARVEIHGTRSE